MNKTPFETALEAHPSLGWLVAVFNWVATGFVWFTHHVDDVTKCFMFGAAVFGLITGYYTMRIQRRAEPGCHGHAQDRPGGRLRRMRRRRAMGMGVAMGMAVAVMVVVGMVVRHGKMLHYNITGVHAVERLEGRLLERPTPSCPATGSRLWRAR